MVQHIQKKIIDGALMGSVYSGVVSREGYVFTTNDIFGASPDECAILRVNSQCGAFIVTAKGNLLIKVSEILKRCLATLQGLPVGISRDLSIAITESFQEKHRKEPGWMQRPLPFLLLLVGYNQERPRRLEYLFARNRVTGIREKDGTKEYVTSFDMQPPVPARNLYYGHSELTQYITRQLPTNGLELETIQLLSCLCVMETQSIDRSVSAGIRMATLSEAEGFAWASEEALHRFSEMGKKVDVRMTRGLFRLFASDGISGVMERTNTTGNS